MSSIRKAKKTMKKSNGFFSVVVNNNMVLCVSEWNILRYHKKGISVDYSEYLPYKIIKKIIIERNNFMMNTPEMADLLLMQDLGNCPN